MKHILTLLLLVVGLVCVAQTEPVNLLNKDYNEVLTKLKSNSNISDIVEWKKTNEGFQSISYMDNTLMTKINEVIFQDNKSVLVGCIYDNSKLDLITEVFNRNFTKKSDNEWQDSSNITTYYSISKSKEDFTVNISKAKPN